MYFTDGHGNYKEIRVHTEDNPYYEKELYDVKSLPHIELSSGERVYIVPDINALIKQAKDFVNSDTSLNNHGFPKRWVNIIPLWVSDGYGTDYI